MNENDRFYKGIEEYLEDSNNNLTISLFGLDDLVDFVYSNIDLPKDICKILIKVILNEIRILLLKGEKLVFANFGTFFISSPKTSKTSKKVFLKFKPSKYLINKLNKK